MFLTPIYVAMTFIRTWRMRSFRARLLEFLGGDTSVAFCRVPENAAETPTLSSKLCTNPKNAHLCDLLDYTNTIRVCSMKPLQSIELRDWVSCGGGLPLGSGDFTAVDDTLDLVVLLECEMEPSEQGYNSSVVSLESIGSPVAWKAGSHLALVVRTNMEYLTLAGFNFVGGEFILERSLPVVRLQTVQVTGEPNRATDPSMRSLRSDIQHNLKKPVNQFQWPVHAALLRKLSKVVDIKTERNSIEMNGTSDHDITTAPKTNLSLTNASVNTIQPTSNEIGTVTENGVICDVDKGTETTDNGIETSNKGTETVGTEKTNKKSTDVRDKPKHAKSTEMIVSKALTETLGSLPVTVELQHNITPKKSSLKLDLKKGTSQLSSSLLNISSQIKSVTTHKRIIGPRKLAASSDKIGKSKERPKSTGSEIEKTALVKPVRVSRPLVNTKLVNVLIYSDSVVTRDNLEASLKKVLDSKSYTIYSVSASALESGAWRGRAALVAVAGDVSGRAAALLLAHVLAGGRLLAICSQLLHTALPYYKTAEVRENEVVQFSYDKWQSVRMKHHIFCYQASPVKKQFSAENDKQPTKYTGHPGHELNIQVLASEETWRTPSLLQATDAATHGIAIFSQIHLEADPSEYLGAEGAPLDTVRLQILQKILGELLGLHTRPHDSTEETKYTRAYFLGNHVHKMSLVERLCPATESGRPRVLQMSPLSLQWCTRDEKPARPPAEDFLPVMMHECPEHFSTVEYFDNLTSLHLGRLVIYSDVMSSSQVLVEAGQLAHGACVVPREQTAGRGRGDNRWVSTKGCAMMSLQVWKKVSTSTPLIQHAAALAVVRAVRTLPGHEHLDIRIKWPNDIYYGREAKIGGVLTTATCQDDQLVVNIGTGVNLSNAQPTTCINEIIRRYNSCHGDSGALLPPLSLERLLARYCSQLERILQHLEEDGGVDAFLEQYYNYWLHDGEVVQVKQPSSDDPISGTIVGLDNSGYLRVMTSRGELTVHPGDNTFDMMSGLIAPRQ